jgi:hypothetical protein
MLCHADADLITYNWKDTQPHPFPDFSINRKCRNINDLIAFRDERKVEMSKYEAMKKPNNVNTIPMELGFYAMVRTTPLHFFLNISVLKKDFTNLSTVRIQFQRDVSQWPRCSAIARVELVRETRS